MTFIALQHEHDRIIFFLASSSAAINCREFVLTLPNMNRDNCAGVKQGDLNIGSVS
jgi:hypothetical protein